MQNTTYIHKYDINAQYKNTINTKTIKQIYPNTQSVNYIQIIYKKGIHGAKYKQQQCPKSNHNKTQKYIRNYTNKQ